MRLLVDTHVVLWLLDGRQSLGAEAEAAIVNAEALLVSIVSFAEISVKVSMGKLTVPDDVAQRVRHGGADILPLEIDHCRTLAQLPLHHRDPFDRLLIAQARSERLTVVTADRRFASYDIPVVSVR